MCLYIVQFVCSINVRSKLTYFERTKKIRKIWKNEIQKKNMNFERTLFDQTTSSPQSSPSHFQDYSTCNNARSEFFHNFCSKLWSKLMVPEKKLFLTIFFFFFANIFLLSNWNPNLRHFEQMSSSDQLLLNKSWIIFIVREL